MPYTEIPNIVTFALFADLSVQFLSEEISPRTLESMATLAGGDE